MDRQQRLLPALAGIALMACLTSVAMAQEPSVELMKTVGTMKNECATNNFLAEVPPDGIVYYCYKMTYTGTITASSHTFNDSVLGDAIHKIPGGKCCTDASGTNCADPRDVCQLGLNSCFGMYPVCVPTTYPGVCCSAQMGMENDCFIPHTPCDDDMQCPGQKCVINPLVGPGMTVTRVITATIPPGGVANTASWTAQPGVCCNDDPTTCDGESNPRFCDTTADCVGDETCRMEGIGLCCDPTGTLPCDHVCLVGRECPSKRVTDPNDPNGPPDEIEFSCELMDTGPASDTAGARVAVFSDTPVLSSSAMALIVLGLVAFAASRLRERQA